MTGKTHKAIGVATGVAFTLYGAKAGMPLLALGMITAPMGAMLPDIDHDNSRIGRKRKNFTKTFAKALKIGTAVVLIGTIVVGLVMGSLLFSLLRMGIIVVPIVACMLVAKSQKVRSKSSFYTKHRGIMHTFTVPVFLMIGCFMIESVFIDSLIFGLAAGYISHLLADCCTKTGCPVLWPLSESRLSLFKITTGTSMEYVMGLILSGGIIWIGYWLGC